MVERPYLGRRKGGACSLVLLLLQGLLILSISHREDSKAPPVQYLHLPSSTSSSEAVGGMIVARGNITDQEAHLSGSFLMSESEGNITHWRRKRLKEDGKTEELAKALEELLVFLSTPTYTCKKLLTMGGFSCNFKRDGEKFVCHDPGVYPEGTYCLVYSLGAGHDFTFDQAMASFGCEVFTFDSDTYHAGYSTFLSERLRFYKVRVGTEFLKEQQYQAEDLASGPFLVYYWPLPAIVARLGHTRNQLHYLKLDIEGDEWKVLEESLFKTNILEETQQLAMEIHFDDLRNAGGSHSPQHLLQVVSRYYRILQGLQDRGFQLAHWEPNHRGPELTTLAGLTFHVFSETLWLNLKFQPHKNLPSRRYPPEKL